MPTDEMKNLETWKDVLSESARAVTDGFVRDCEAKTEQIKARHALMIAEHKAWLEKQPERERRALERHREEMHALVLRTALLGVGLVALFVLILTGAFK